MRKLVLGAIALVLSVNVNASIVRMETTLGNIDIELFDNDAPITVANFMNYVNDGDYINSFFHRNVPGFILQGGGFTFQNNLYGNVPTDAPIVNEFDPSRSNLRGTLAMAKTAAGPDSATSQWFFNLSDNSANLDVQNDGFTVFAQVLNEGMDIVDATNVEVTPWNVPEFHSYYATKQVVINDMTYNLKGISPSGRGLTPLADTPFLWLIKLPKKIKQVMHTPSWEGRDEQ